MGLLDYGFMQGVLNPGMPADMSRPVLKNPDGSFSTERTITVESGGKHYLIPTIVAGREVSPEQAKLLWRGGDIRAVGVYDSEQEAEQAAVARSQQLGKLRGLLSP